MSKETTKIAYPINCKECKENITTFQVSKNLLDKYGPMGLNLNNLSCQKCINKKQI